MKIIAVEVSHINDMKDMFMQIPQNVEIAIHPKESTKTCDRYWWWMVYGKSARGLLPPLKRTKLSKKAQERKDLIQKNYMKLMGSLMIVNSNYIGKILNGLILDLTPKELNPIMFLQKIFILVEVIEKFILLAILD